MLTHQLRPPHGVQSGHAAINLLRGGLCSWTSFRSAAATSAPKAGESTRLKHLLGLWPDLPATIKCRYRRGRVLRRRARLSKVLPLPRGLEKEQQPWRPLRHCGSQRGCSRDRQIWALPQADAWPHGVDLLHTCKSSKLEDFDLCSKHSYGLPA